MGAEKPITDLSALETIVDDFLTWRRRMILPALGLLTLCIVIPASCYWLLPISGTFGLWPAALSGGLVLVSAFLFSEHAKRLVTHKALPILCESIGTTYNIDSYAAQSRIQGAALLGLFPNRDISVSHSVLRTTADKLSFDAFKITHSSNKTTTTDFEGYLVTFQTEMRMNNLLIREARSKTARKITEFFGGNRPLAQRCDTEILLQDKGSVSHNLSYHIPNQDTRFAIFHDGSLGETTGAMSNLTRGVIEIHEALPRYARLQAISVQDGMIRVAIFCDYSHFYLDSIMADKVTLMRRFSEWLAICALPLDIFSIWHDNNPKSDLED